MLHSDSLVVTGTSRKPASGEAPALDDEAVPLFVDSWQGKAGAGRVLLIVHGLGEHGGRYRHLPKYLGEDFERFYAMDQRGHGRSGGLRGYAPSFEHLVEDVKRVTAEIQQRERDKKIYLLAHSFGGLVGLKMLLSEHDLPFAGAIISSPLLGVTMRVPAYKQMLGQLLGKALARFQLSNEINPSHLSHDPLVVEAYVKDRLVHNKITPGLYNEITKTMGWVQTQEGPVHCPVLFILPGDDRVVDTAVTRKLYENLKGDNKKLCEYPDFYHEILNETGKEQAFEDIKKWLARTEKPKAKKSSKAH